MDSLVCFTALVTDWLPRRASKKTLLPKYSRLTPHSPPSTPSSLDSCSMELIEPYRGERGYVIYPALQKPFKRINRNYIIFHIPVVPNSNPTPNSNLQLQTPTPAPTPTSTFGFRDDDQDVSLLLIFPCLLVPHVFRLIFRLGLSTESPHIAHTPI